MSLNIWALVIGVVYLAGAPPSPSLAATVTAPWSYTFAAGLILGGGMSLVGCFWLSDIERALELERAGMVALTGTLLIFVVAVIVTIGLPGLFVGGFTGAWCWANIRRAFQCTADLKRLREGR